MKPITGRQREVLRFVAAHVNGRGYPPTLREISEHFGWTSDNAARDHLEALEAKGCVERDPGKTRAIRVLVDPDAEPDDEVEAALEEINTEGQ